MNDYVGKICPYCKTEIQPDDDIVVCSQCEMPHHKDCWVENQGCTTFGCLGTIKNAGGEENSVTATQMQYEEAAATVYCAQCGAANDAAYAFCAQCGSRLTPAPQPAQTYQQPAYDQAAYQQQMQAYQQQMQAYQQQAQAYQQPAQTYQQPTYQQSAYDQNAYQQQAYQQAAYQQTAYQQQTTYQQPTQQAAYQQSYQQTAYQQPAYQQTAYQAGGAYQTAAIDTDVITLIGTKQEYYVPKFQEMKAQNKQTTWNWAAFLVAPYWLIYRKMYLYGGILMAVTLLLSLLAAPALAVLSFAACVAFGLYGNKLYMNYLEGKAAEAKGMPEPDRTMFIANNSGVNSGATVIAIVAYFVLNFLILL